MKELGHSSDLSVRMIESPHQKSVKPTVIHLDGLADGNIIMEWKELIPTGKRAIWRIDYDDPSVFE
ncbi:hypothetical protein P4601_10920 [Peribacillus frigoritolerans]|uniref:hypothetical protein n=1 Tax=Peribacillus frigoritolerans TaxID=450367 RepID=UPI002E1A769A|nr:hypothetical protein [Peribacillus frigoritolerans]